MRFPLLMALLSAFYIFPGCDSEMGEPPQEHQGFAIDEDLSGSPSTTPESTGSAPSTRPGNEPPENGSQNPPPANDGLTCEEIYAGVAGCYENYQACASPCQDQGCADSCEETYWNCLDGEVSKGSPAGQSAFNSVRACEDQNYQACYDKGGLVFDSCSEACGDDACAKACAEQATQVLATCMEDACANEFVQCGLLDEAATPEPAPETPPEAPVEDPSAAPQGTACKGIYEAVGACYETYYNCASPCEDQACADACEATYWDCFDGEVAKGSVNAQAEFNALRTCEDEHYQACYDDGGVVFNECAEACNNDDCTQACAQEANDILTNCMLSNCQDEFSACGVFDDATPDDGNTLPDDAGSGLTCSELYACEDACNGNQNCGQACYDSGSNEAKSEWTNLIQCGQVFCNGQVADAAGYKMCLQQMCSPEYGTCFGPNAGGGNGGGAPPQGGGTGTCGEGLDCIKTCYATAESEQAFYGCVDACYGAMDATAHSLIDALASCADVQCANVPGSIENYFQCQQDFCSNQYNACMSQL